MLDILVRYGTALVGRGVAWYGSVRYGFYLIIFFCHSNIRRWPQWPLLIFWFYKGYTMAQQIAEYRVVGSTPLLMDNPGRYDPNHPSYPLYRVRQTTSLKGRKPAKEPKYLFWLSSLYLKESKLILPSFVFESAMFGATRKLKMPSKAFKKSVFVTEDSSLDIGVEYSDLNELYADHHVDYSSMDSLTVKRLPKFDHWSSSFKVLFDDSVISLDLMARVVQAAGQGGVGCGRPRYGRFEVSGAIAA